MRIVPTKGSGKDRILWGLEPPTSSPALLKPPTLLASSLRPSGPQGPEAVPQVKRSFSKAAAFALCAILFTLCASASPSWAATYYVDATNGNDNNDGVALSTAWKTIAKVNSLNFLPGDYILFKRGEIWQEQIVAPSSGSPSAPITFGAYGSGDRPIIDGAGKNYAIHVRSKGNITIENIHVKHGELFGILVAYAENVTIQDCEVEEAQEINIQVGGSDNVTIKGCDIHHAKRQHGVYLDGLVEDGTDNPTIEYCDIHHNYGNGVQVNCNGIYRVKNPVVRWCKLRHNGYAGEGNGLQDQGSNGAQYYYNLIYSNGLRGIALGHDSVQDPDGNLAVINAKVHNNTIVGHDETSFPCIWVDSKVNTGIEIKNNIITANEPYLIRVDSGGDAILDYNCYYASDFKNAYYWKGTNYSSLSAWQAATGQHANSIESYPQFADHANYDFTLQSDSPCIDAGTNVGLDKDFSGATVPQGQGVDIGAFEYRIIVPPKNMRILTSS